MDRLILEAKTEVKEASVQTQADEKQEVKKIEITLEEKVISKQEQKEQEKIEEKVEEVEEKKEIYDGYLSNFENLTLSDVKPQEAVKEEDPVAEVAEEVVEEEKPLAVQERTVKKLIIEKPNYDFIAKSNKKEKPKRKGKLKTIVLACALAVCSVLCVSGAVMCDQLNNNYLELQDTYDLNLRSYLSNINKLNITNQGLEFLETYPEELNTPSSIGKTSNWFDRIANFIAGLFGG